MDNSKFLQDAKILFASGQLEKSIQAFTIAEQKGCNPVDVYLSRGACQLALGRHAEAKDDFTRALESDKNNERAHYFRGIACIALKEYREAIDDLTFSLARNNDRGIAHLARGIAYAELGDESDAALDFNGSNAFSEAEIRSFKKLFGDKATPFRNTRAMLSKENAPWNNLLSKESADKLSRLLQ